MSQEWIFNLRQKGKLFGCRYLAVSFLATFIFSASSFAATEHFAVVGHKEVGRITAPSQGVLSLIHKKTGSSVRSGQFLAWYYSGGENVPLRATEPGFVVFLKKKGLMVFKDETIAKIVSKAKVLKLMGKAQAFKGKVGSRVYDAHTNKRIGKIEHHTHEDILASVDRGEYKVGSVMKVIVR